MRCDCLSQLAPSFKVTASTGLARSPFEKWPILVAIMQFGERCARWEWLPALGKQDFAILFGLNCIDSPKKAAKCRQSSPFASCTGCFEPVACREMKRLTCPAQL